MKNKRITDKPRIAPLHQASKPLSQHLHAGRRGSALVEVVDAPPGLLDNKSSVCRLDHGEKIQPSSSRSGAKLPLYNVLVKMFNNNETQIHVEMNIGM